MIPRDNTIKKNWEYCNFESSQYKRDPDILERSGYKKE